MLPKPIKVLIVDDSAMIREFMRSVLDAEPDIKVVGAAADPYFARDKIKRLKPDVLTLDIEMPRMDGLTFLQKLMAARPMPVVMFSKATQQGAEATLRALRLGAVEVVGKPTANLQESLPTVAQEIVSKVRAAARARLFRPGDQPHSAPAHSPLGDEAASSFRPAPQMVVVMGASTGGTVALERVLAALPAESPPIAVVQHLPAQFTAPFAQRLDQKSAIRVLHAQDFQPLAPGQALIAPGGKHLILGQRPAWLLRPGQGRPPGEPPQALGGRSVPLGRDQRGQQGHGRHYDRHGQRRGQGRQGDAPGRWSDRGPERGHLGNLRHGPGGGGAGHGPCYPAFGRHRSHDHPALEPGQARRAGMSYHWRQSRWDPDATILIVDDSRLNRELLISALSPRGKFRFLEAGNGQEAVEQLQSHHVVDLILLDLIMPVMDG